ncbi:MAG: xanthine dehydrogenase family protein molybdopterin-binding subunit, partial [Myxococcales bacterium]|nr:xanthine dehydrogenase family protein molybdopterin-binding subunit [Myxococcales bacterium]
CTQAPVMDLEGLAGILGLPLDRIRIVPTAVGGGFGSKLGIHDDAVLASLGAIATDRPVRVVQTRRDLFSSAPHRGCSTQRVRLGASRDGRLLAVAHESVMPMARGYEFAEPCAASARASYACDGILTRHRVVRADLPRIDSMRGPGEAVGSLAFESAVDELARALERDPVAFRLANVAETEPISGKPFASFDLRRCLEVGAERYGWSRRAERGRRDGRWLLGHGVASATRPNFLMEAKARVRLEDDGRAVAELDMTDIGTGSYTILSQIVADTLELPLDRVEVRLGDSRYPQTAGSGGSFGAASAGGALLSACRRLRGQLRAGGGREAEGHIEPGEDFEKYAQYMTGAHFVEVGVDEVTSEVRVRRAVGAFSFGRVLNPTTARSQLYGGMVFGIGGALTEGLHLDERVGAYMNRDLAGYHLPTERDVPALEVVMIGERDDRCGLLGSKGVGELGLCGLGAAITNAVYDACGARVRRFPLTPDAVMAARAAW